MLISHTRRPVRTHISIQMLICIHIKCRTDRQTEANMLPGLRITQGLEKSFNSQLIYSNFKLFTSYFLFSWTHNSSDSSSSIDESAEHHLSMLCAPTEGQWRSRPCWISQSKSSSVARSCIFHCNCFMFCVSLCIPVLYARVLVRLLSLQHHSAKS